ncbi:MAG: hypothetical protein EPN17_11420 [Methylobacter sp.]|nr:MAG: hypothetical protein EPN17_11420 [Methylobacter sp.]
MTEKQVGWTKAQINLFMDYLTVVIIDMFESLEFDRTYIEHTLAGKDKLTVLLWCNNLDSKYKAALADKLGVELNDFTITLKTLTQREC